MMRQFSPASAAQVADVDEIRRFWDANPCGSRLSVERDRRRYFDEIERKRYTSESHIPRVAHFAEFRDRRVLEIGCGIGTDGLQFARHGARYFGLDLAPAAAKITKEHLELYGAPPEVLSANAEALPFPDDTFDHVYSFGVIHHSPHTEAIVGEIQRVLKPGGTFCVMVYNRSSINYYVEILVLRKLLRLLLLPPSMPRLLAGLTGFPEWKLQGHREILLRKRGISKEEWISMNTDGPFCPLAKVYDREEALALVAGFVSVRTEVWHFDRSHWSWIGRALPDAVGTWLGRRWGWHRLLYGSKAFGSASK